jgi:hypothetical protein
MRARCSFAGHSYLYLVDIILFDISKKGFGFAFCELHVIFDVSERAKIAIKLETKRPSTWEGQKNYFCTFGSVPTPGNCFAHFFAYPKLSRRLRLGITSFCERASQANQKMSPNMRALFWSFQTCSMLIASFLLTFFFGLVFSDVADLQDGDCFSGGTHCDLVQIDFEDLRFNNESQLPKLLMFSNATNDTATKRRSVFIHSSAEAAEATKTFQVKFRAFGEKFRLRLKPDRLSLGGRKSTMPGTQKSHQKQSDKNLNKRPQNLRSLQVAFSTDTSSANRTRKFR